jgi:methylated-DNA-protein-cysteine methyltransferase-like protein
MDEINRNEEPSLYSYIYTLVRMIPSGKVTTYGRVAALVRRITPKGCTPRMVGYALAALKKTALQEDVPWQRVINAQGKISVHGDGWGNALQRQLLEAKG